MTDIEYHLEKVDFAALVLGDRHDGPEVGVLAGEGIGPAVVDVAIRVTKATGARVNWRRIALKTEDCRKNSGKIPAEILDELRGCRAILKGPLPAMACPDRSGLSAAQLLRRSLGLLVHKTEIRPLPGLNSAAGNPNLGLHLFRERPESIYASLDEDTGPIFEKSDVFLGIASKLANAVCADAARHGQRKVIIVPDRTHTNWCNEGSLSMVRRILENQSAMHCEELEPKEFAAKVITAPDEVGVVLTSHNFGEIACHLCGALNGGAHLAPSVTYGTGAALFESSIECAGAARSNKVVNPTAMVRAAILMLDHIGEDFAAGRLRTALHAVYRDGRNLTPDVGGRGTTTGFANAVIEAMEASCTGGRPRSRQQPVASS